MRNDNVYPAVFLAYHNKDRKLAGVLFSFLIFYKKNAKQKIKVKNGLKSLHF